MPIYEYRCLDCGRISGHLVMKPADRAKVACRGCGGKKLEKVISRVTVHKTEAQRLKDFDASKARGESYYRDSRNVGLWAKKRAEELGLDLGDSFEETLEKGRTGKILEEDL